MVVRGGPGQPIVFIHIPRTAGTSFIAALVEALQPQAPFVGYDRWVFGPFSDFEQLAPGIRQQLVRHPGDIPAQADAVMGHLTPSTIRARFSESRQLTVLREPRTRMVSHWLWSRGQTNLTLRGWGDWAGYVKLARSPLDTLLDDPEAAFYTDNLITRCLVWPHTLTPDDDFIDERRDDELIEIALATLAGFDFVGVIEDPLVPERVSRHLGTELRMSWLNQASLPRGNAKCAIAEECARADELLTQRTRLDAVLWDYVATATYLPRSLVEQERDSLYRAAIEHYEFSMAEGQAQGSGWGQVLARSRSGAWMKRPRDPRPPVLSR